MKLPNASPFFPPTPAAGSAAEHGQLERQPAEVRHPRLVPDGSRMAKGISLTEEELKTLKGILDDMEL